MSKIHGGNIFQFAHEQRIEPYEVVDFSANINPLGPSQRGLDALNAQLRYISHYPDATNDDVLNAIADTYEMDKHQIIVGNGYYMLFAVYLDIQVLLYQHQDFLSIKRLLKQVRFLYVIFFIDLGKMIMENLILRYHIWH